MKVDTLGAPAGNAGAERGHPSGDVVRIVGRSSSHFTRVVRIFAEELGVAHELHVVPNLMTSDASAYGGNPGLRLPSLLATGKPPVFGCLNSCRALAEASSNRTRVLWPEDLTLPIARNALELTLQSMSTEVSWIMLSVSGGKESDYAVKLRLALAGMLAWLDEHIDGALGELGLRDFSFFEACLFCLVEHLPFREVVSVEPYSNLLRFRDRFAARSSAAATSFRYDP
jgi:glutathione S-transferase